MNKIQWTDFFREIRKSRSRYLSLLFIVALGTAFYAGIRSSEPDMTQSADRYYDETNFMDIRVLSTLGMTEDDLNEIRSIDGVLDAEAGQNGEYFALCESDQPIISLVSLGENINQFSVKEGRLPEADDEIFVDINYIERQGCEIGDTVTLLDSDKENPEDLTLNTFTITGCGTWAWYLNLTRGSASIGDGTVDAFMVVRPEVFDRDYYSVVYARVSGVSELNCYSDEYEDRVDEVTDRIEEIADARCEIRYEDVYAKGQEKLDDARKKVSDAEKELADAEKELNDGEAEYSDGLAEYEDGKKEYEDGKAEYEDGLKKYSDGKKELADARNELDNGWDSYNKGLAQFNDGKAELDSARTQLEDGQKALEEAKDTLSASKKELAQGRKTLDEKSAQVEEGEAALAEGEEQLEAAKQQLSDQETALLAAKSRYESGLAQYEAGVSALDSKKQEYLAVKDYLPPDQAAAYEAQFAAAEEELTQSKAALDAAQDQIIQGEAAIATGWSQIDEQEGVLSEKKQELASAREVIAAGYAELEAGEAQLADGEAQLKEKEAELESARSELSAGEKKLADSEAELKAARKKLDDGEASYSDGKKELNDSEKKLSDAAITLNDAKKELDDGEKKLSDAREELDDGWKEYEDARVEADEKIADAREEIADGQKELDDLSLPEWYVLDRNTVQTSVEYGQDSERIGNIGKVFPVIFFLVAALVCLTTMTRMIEEERMLIGTMKALGYGKLAIASKYILYAFSATIVGGVIGVLVGSKILPYVIMTAYGMLYSNVPYKLMPLSTEHCLVSIGLAVLCTVGAAFAACYKELMSVPAALMRPPVPKMGRKIFLERLPFIWKRLSFSVKSTIRNLIRYKKRFIMTVVGIGGCMALLLVSYGLHDAISAIVENQYKKIWTYSISCNVEEKDSQEEKEALKEKILTEHPEISEGMFARSLSLDASTDAATKNVYLYVVEGIEQMKDFLDLHDRTSKESYTLSDEGVIISEKLGKSLEVSPGDTITLKLDDTTYKEVKVLAAAENYLYNYVYMTPAMYESLYGEEPAFNELYFRYADSMTEEEELAVSEYLLSQDEITSVGLASVLQSKVDDMMNALNLVVWVLTIAAGLLVFVVTFNLNNINISERRRELASLKVLGFYDMEVAMYVYRENIFLTLFGILAGLFMGTWLDQYVIRTLEVEMIMFGRDISAYSYLMSSLLTIVFSVIVNGFMYYKLKQIDMVESLKSVE